MIGAAPRILIVDDEVRNCELLELLLQPEGYVTVSAADGETALAEVAASAPDLILLDAIMPGMDGFQVACRLNADPSTSNIPIIMVTAHADRRARLAGLEAGAEEFLTKPVDRAELWLRVRNLLRLKNFNDFLRDHSAVLEQQVQARTADLQRFRAAMDSTADAIMLMNRTTMHFVEVNATACSMLGYTREELVQLSPTALGIGSPQELETLYDRIIAGHGPTERREAQLRRKDGSYVDVEVQRHAHRSGADWIVVGVVRDITERKEAARRLHQLAHYDALTGLPNRTLFHQALVRALEEASSGARQVALLCIDLDHFKNVNDTLDHATGDDLLTQFGNRLVHGLGIRDTIGRLGGDEFAVTLLVDDGQRGAALVASKVRELLSQPFEVKGHEVTLTASVGIALHPHDARDAQSLLKFADTAMYRAKQAGRNTSRFFTAGMNTEALARLELESALRKAIKNEEFVLHYQPKVDLESGRIIGLESLLRWQRPGHGLVPPNHFIPILEETGLIVEVGSWVVATVCKQIGVWQRSAVGALQVAVNVSGRQLIDGDLDTVVASALASGGIPGELLELELTESSLMVNTDHTVECLRGLKRRGVRLSIDDFGTGYSSLAYLGRFPVDKLKIDIVFVRNITTSADDAVIVLAIIGLAHSLKLQVIAEGVETLEQLSYLRRHGCDQIQGYYFSKPLALAEVEQLLLAKKRLPGASSESAAIPAVAVGR